MSKKKAPAAPSNVSSLAAASSRPPESEGRPADSDDPRAVAGVCIFLAAIIWVVFGQTLHYGFVNFDDDKYVYENPAVAGGLTLKGIVWAFTRVYAFNWHPVTWISHMLDCQLYGLNPGGHHLTNILLHTAAAILLFLVLREMTGFLWRSAFVATVFAIHPLHVESVAWVAERKDVLSGLFFMLTVGAYVRYARCPGSPARYGLVLLLFALGLMCKPMLVTLPFVLVLLDYWPLNRLGADAGAQPVFRLGGWLIPRRPILEKLPMLGLVAASCAATLFAQSKIIRWFEQVPFRGRVGNALVSCVAYLGQMFWPSGLAVLYPFPAHGWPRWETTLAPILLIAISAGVFDLRKTRPYLLVGWLWYLVMLAPVIGILQVGPQARADRYTYLPQIGLYLLLAWSAADLCAGWRGRRVLLGGGAACALATMILCARAQTSHWRDSESLWTRAIACTSGNFIAHCNLGYALLQTGETGEAIAHFQKAIEINPDSVYALNSLGLALFQNDHVDDAISDYEKALRIKPGYVEAWSNLGNAMRRKGNLDEAIVYYQKALQINPDFAEAHSNLGGAVLQKGDLDQAVACYQKALEINPGFMEAHYGLGNALLRKGAVDQAISQYQQALSIKPDNAKLLNMLAWVLAICPQASLRNGPRAVELAQRANQLSGDANPVFLGTLAAAYAEAGRFPEAVQTAQRALQLAGSQPDTALVTELRSELQLYQSGLPFHLGNR
jgi:tetratricopeptide (TPR) repeat protein